ncbi:MAG: DJ-1/PfpI family protein [Metamycoplasmataceae bacterium]
MKILTLVLPNYQDIELNSFIGSLNMSEKLELVDYYNPDQLDNIFGSNKIGSIKMTKNKINVEDYDALYIPGGAMAIELRKNQKALDVVREFIKKNKYVVAHCDSPNALYDSGIFVDKKYISYPITNDKSYFSPKRLTDDSLVCVDEKYISGRGPWASLELGLKTIEILISKEMSEITRNRLFGKN